MYKSILLISCLCSSLALAQTAPATSVQLTESRLSYEVPTMDIAGTISSLNNTELTAGIDGRLSWVAEAGTTVVAGQAVLRLMDPASGRIEIGGIDSATLALADQRRLFAEMN